MITEISDKKSASIRRQHADAVAALQTATAELDRAMNAVADDEVNAIVTGKAKNPVLRNAVTTLQTKIADLEAALPALTSALALVQAQEGDLEAQARAQRLLQLQSDYKAAVRVLNDAVQSAATAQRTADELHRQFARVENGAAHVQRIGCRSDLSTVEGLVAFENQLCTAGFADLLPVDSIGRQRFEHGRAHDEARAKAIEAARSPLWRELNRIANGGQPTEHPDVQPLTPIPGRTIVFQGEINTGQLSA